MPGRWIENLQNTALSKRVKYLSPTYLPEEGPIHEHVHVFLCYFYREWWLERGGCCVCVAEVDHLRPLHHGVPLRAELKEQSDDDGEGGHILGLNNYKLQFRIK